jgi:hypothetical protein
METSGDVVGLDCIWRVTLWKGRVACVELPPLCAGRVVVADGKVVEVVVVVVMWLR